MVRNLSALALLGALLAPGLAVAQSPLVGSPLGTLEGFQEFLTAHGLALELGSLDGTPDAWGASGDSDTLGAYALGRPTP
jgi:hypothetical protein